MISLDLRDCGNFAMDNPEKKGAINYLPLSHRHLIKMIFSPSKSCIKSLRLISYVINEVR